MTALTHVGSGYYLAPAAAASYLRALAAGAPSGITTAWRSREFQEQLYAAYLAGTGALASRPGTSKHEIGMALDIPEPARAWFQTWGRAYGWVRTNSEPWHFEYRIDQDQHLNDRTPITPPKEADVSLTPAESESVNECRRMLGVLLGWNPPAEGSPEAAALAALRGPALEEVAQRAAELVVNHENVTEPRRMLGALLGWNAGTGPEPARIAQITRKA